jgi:hypothetical protein
MSRLVRLAGSRDSHTHVPGAVELTIGLKISYGRELRCTRGTANTVLKLYGLDTNGYVAETSVLAALDGRGVAPAPAPGFGQKPPHVVQQWIVGIVPPDLKVALEYPGALVQRTAHVVGRTRLREERRRVQSIRRMRGERGGPSLSHRAIPSKTWFDRQHGGACHAVGDAGVSG